MIQYIGDEIFTNTETFHFFGACKKNKGVFGNSKHSFIYCMVAIKLFQCGRSHALHDLFLRHPK